MNKDQKIHDQEIIIEALTYRLDQAGCFGIGEFTATGDAYEKLTEGYLKAALERANKAEAVLGAVKILVGPSCKSCDEKGTSKDCLVRDIIELIENGGLLK